MIDNRLEESERSERFAVHSDDVREGFRLAFDSVKHLMTLTGAVLAVFATFLDGIFPHELEIETKVLIGLAFALFTLSLVFSAFSMWRIAGLVRSRREYEKKKKKIRWNILLPSLTFIIGLNLFGTAVLLNVFFGGGDFGTEEIIGRVILYLALISILIMVVAWVRSRVRRGDQRDAEGKYEVMYPFVKDYDELVAREMPEKAFLMIQSAEEDEEQPYDHNKRENVHEDQRGNGEATLQMLDERQQATVSEAINERRQVYVDLLSLTHPQKLAVIGSHVSIDFFDFRDAANKIEAQILLMSQTEVGEIATNLVNTFIDCVVAEERRLSEKRKVEALEELIYGDKRRQGYKDKTPRERQTKLMKRQRERVEELKERRAELKERQKVSAEKSKELRKVRNEFVDLTRKDLDPSRH